MECTARTVQQDLGVRPDAPQFLLHFDRIKETLPKLFEDQWHRWEADHPAAAFRVYNRKDMCVLEIRRLASDDWMAWIVMAEVKVASLRDKSLRRVLVRAGLLPQ